MVSALPFDKSFSLSTAPFDLIHYDVWRLSYFYKRGSRYYVSFIDLQWSLQMQLKQQEFCQRTTQSDGRNSRKQRSNSRDGSYLRAWALEEYPTFSPWSKNSCHLFQNHCIIVSTVLLDFDLKNKLTESLGASNFQGLL